MCLNDIYIGKIMQQKKHPFKSIKILSVAYPFVLYKDVGVGNKGSMTIDRLLQDYQV